jgi:hypothetical protein
MNDTWNIKARSKQNYCKKLVHKIPVIHKNKTLQKQVGTICNELYNINNFLVNTYDDIFRKKLGHTHIIKNMLKIKNSDGERILTKKEAFDILSNFLKINNKSNHQTGGGEQGSPVQGSPVQGSPVQGSPVPGSPAPGSPAPGSLAPLPGMSEFYNSDSDGSGKQGDEFPIQDVEISDEQETQFKKDVLEKNFDMVEMMLICLSLFPMMGWMFDFYLVAYALIQKKYGLAIITILNWYIWGFWSLFGMNPFVNLGPLFKFGYLGNQGSKIKRIFGCGKLKHDKYFKDEILQSQGINTKPTKLLHPKYGTEMNFLVDDRTGFVYNSVIRHPEIIGVIKNKNKQDYAWKGLDLNFDKVVRDREQAFIKKKNKGSNLKFTKPCQLPKMRDSASIIRAERLQDQKTPEEFKMVKNSIESAKKKEEDKAANAPINPPGVPSQLQNRLQNAQLVSGARGGSTAIDPLVKHDDRVIENINKVH